MKLSGMLAAIALIAVSPVAAAQAHGAAGGIAVGAGHGGGVRTAMASASVGARAGARRVAFRAGRFDNHRGFRDRFRGRDFALGLYPFWGWDCAPDGGCDWDSDDRPGATPVAYADPPSARAVANECSDWVWQPRLHRSVCAQPYRG